MVFQLGRHLAPVPRTAPDIGILLSSLKWNLISLLMTKCSNSIAVDLYISLFRYFSLWFQSRNEP